MKSKFITAFLGALSISLVSAQTVPTLINYQGKLTDSNGNPLPTDDYTLQFSLFDAPSGGSPIWGPEVFDGVAGTGHGSKIPVVAGYFNVILGPTDTTSRSILNAFASSARYLEITVGTGVPIAPRQQILSSPYSLKTESAHSLDGLLTAFGGQIQGNLDVTGNLNLDGKIIPGDHNDPNSALQVDGRVRIFGAWDTSFALNTVYKPDCDGFAVAYIQGLINPTQAQLKFMSGTSNPPTTVRSIITSRLDQARDIDIQNSAMIPVKAGEYFEIILQVTVGSQGSDAFYIPLGNGTNSCKLNQQN